MVTFTVMAGLVTPPDDGVTVSVVVVGFGRFPVQPATVMNTSIAPAMPMRVRKRRVAGIMNSRAIASITRSSCCLAVGGTFMDSGATMNEAAVSVPLIMAPGAAAALVVGTAHAVTSVLPGVQVNETAPVNPPSPVMVTGKVPMAPLATLALPAETEKSQAIPVSETDCGLPLALSVIVSDPVTGPGVVPAAGANVTLTVQLAPTAKLVPHVVVSAKLVEVLGGLVKFNTALPLLVRVTGGCGALVVVNNWPPKARLETEIPRTGALLVPAPVSATWIGWDGPSRASTIFSVADSAPAIDGVKTTPMVQPGAPGASDEPHGVVPPAAPTKSAALAPVVVGGSVKSTEADVLFVRVTNCADVGAPMS